MPNQLVVSTSPTLPVFTNRLHIMPTRSGQSYSIEWRPQSEQQIKAATTENNDKSFASDRQRRLQNRGKGQLANPKENFWRVITRLLYIIPKLVDVLKTPGLTCMQYFCSGSVICIIVLCLVLLYSNPDHHLWCRSTSKGHRGTTSCTLRHTYVELVWYTWRQNSFLFLCSLLSKYSPLWHCCGNAQVHGH